MGDFAANDVVNGLYGYVYDENGVQLQATQEFDSKIDFDKKEVAIAGKLLKSNKVVGAKATGSIKILKVDSRLQQKIAENPTAKYTYLGKLADPTANGEEAILYKGVSFDGTPLTSFKLGELGEVDLNFTFDDFSFVETID